MSRSEAMEEYQKALKLGLKEVRECQSRGRPTNPAVLHQLIGDIAADHSVSVGLVEVPANRIVGTKTAGRISAFSPSFLPWRVYWVSFCGYGSFLPLMKKVCCRQNT